MRAATLRPIAPLTLAMLLLTGCGGKEAPPTPAPTADASATSPPPSQAAASGIAGVIAGKEDAGKDLPGFVERPEGVRILTTAHFDSGKRRGGTVLYAANQSPDALIAFHKAALGRHQLVAGAEIAGKRGERILDAESGDGETGLRIAVHPPKDNGDVVVELGYFLPTTP